MPGSSSRDKGASRSRSRSTAKSKSPTRHKRARDSKSPSRTATKAKTGTSKGANGLDKKRRNLVADAFSKLEAKKKQKASDGLAGMVVSHVDRSRDISGELQVERAESPEEGEAIQGSEEITEAKELSQPFTDAEEPAFVEETLDSPLDISDSPLDFISLEVDDTGSTKLQTTDPSTTTPEPDDQQQPSVDASEAVDPSNDQQQWYTDAQGNWITAEEYQKQWEVYNQQMEAYQASHGQDVGQEANVESTGGPMSDSGPESHELHPLLQGGIHGPEMISAAEKLAEGDKKQSDDVDGKDTGDSGSEEGQIANGEVENNYSYDYSQYYQPQDWSYLHTYYPPPNDQSEAAQPCNTLYVKGISGISTERELIDLMQERYEGVQRARLRFHRDTKLPRDFGFVEFDTVENAAAALEKSSIDPLKCGDETLTFRYSFRPIVDRTSEEWTCSTCTIKNPASEALCSQCESARPIVAYEETLEETSSTLMIQNLPIETTEEELKSELDKHSKCKEMIYVRDKQTGAFKQHCYVKFLSNSEAHQALDILEEKELELAGQSVKVVATWAYDLAKDRSTSNIPLAQLPPARYPSTSYAYSGQPQSQAYAMQPYGQQYAQQSSFQYDPASGYWWDPASGYYWDANSGLYFDNASKNWLQMDQTTGQMYAVQQYQGQGVSNAAEAALMAAQTAGLRTLQDLHAPEVQYRPPPDAKKRGAVIGSAAKLNAASMLDAKAAKAQEAKAKLEAERRKEAAMAARKTKQESTGVRVGVMHIAQSRPTVMSSAPRPMSAAIARPPLIPPISMPRGPPLQARPIQPTPPPQSIGGVVKGVIRSSGKKWG